MSSRKSPLHFRGYLLHLTHYDPPWWANKNREEPFDPQVAEEVLDALVEQGFNMLMIGVSDGVRYKSHPELARHYSQPMSILRKLAEQARQRGLQVVPKLNFSRSEVNRHSEWMIKPGEAWHEHFDDEYAWKLGFDVIDEIIQATQPERFFHVGMDEDHSRSIQQFTDAIFTLRKGLKKRRLRTVTWSDSSLDYPSGQVYREKSEAAEKELPSDVVRILWNYWAVPRKEFRQIRKQGLELWGAPGAQTEDQLVRFRDELISAGGTGLIMTHWKPCTVAHREELLDRIQTFGPHYSV